MAPAQVKSQESKPLPVYFHKTRMCKFFLSGQCIRGADCTFAHNESELADTPDLFRTEMCHRFMNSGKCPNGANCHFAHSRAQLRRAGPPGAGAKGKERPNRLRLSTTITESKMPKGSKGDSVDRRQGPDARKEAFFAGSVQIAVPYLFQSANAPSGPPPSLFLLEGQDSRRLSKGSDVTTTRDDPNSSTDNGSLSCGNGWSRQTTEVNDFYGTAYNDVEHTDPRDQVQDVHCKAAGKALEDLRRDNEELRAQLAAQAEDSRSKANSEVKHRDMFVGVAHKPLIHGAVAKSLEKAEECIRAAVLLKDVPVRIMKENASRACSSPQASEKLVLIVKNSFFEVETVPPVHPRRASSAPAAPRQQ
mmetsp:Transcript_55556/g.172157  ORF Transcript_55556/g.172157 Transcript_55556/m.172157 type:complete len:362 (-) Transcript_55556:158-1243(-)